MAKQNKTRSNPELGKRMEALGAKFGIVYFPEQRQPIIDKYGLKA